MECFMPSTRKRLIVEQCWTIHQREILDSCTPLSFGMYWLLAEFFLVFMVLVAFGGMWHLSDYLKCCCRHMKTFSKPYLEYCRFIPGQASYLWHSSQVKISSIYSILESFRFVFEVYESYIIPLLTKQYKTCRANSFVDKGTVTLTF